MTHLLEDDSKKYTAVLNAEEQYSLWPTDREAPNGWTRVGPEGTRQEVLAYIEQVWTDMRPRSLREAMSAS
jgi:MbtH protein